ncbi:MAG: glycerate kinase [Eubacteriales bacterium]|nr:glycerate kinase [Eubacteriales bacterium]
MEVKRFGLGVRFDVVDILHEADIERQMWEEIFSVLTVSDVSGMMLYGGVIHAAPGGPEGKSYLCVFTNGSLKEMRRVFYKLDNDAGINMYLSATQPYLQAKALSHVEGLTYFGKVHRDGTIIGGDGTPISGVRINKKHGKSRPVGKGIRFLLAPDSFGGEISSIQAIKSLTLAARSCFAGVRILPLPMTAGGPGTLDALLMACDGAMHTTKVTSADGKRTEAWYAVLRGTLAVIEMAAVLGEKTRQAAGLTQDCEAYSFAAGELVRRVLDEGIREVCICMGGCGKTDHGLGFLQALGVKLYDAEDNALTGANINVAQVARVDMEYLHPRVKDAHFTLMCDSTDMLCDIPNAEAYGMALSKAAEQDIASIPGSGMAGGLAAAVLLALHAKTMGSVEATLNAAEFDRLLRGVSLVVTGEGSLESGKDGLKRIAPEIVARCEKAHIPVAIMTGSMDAGAEELLRIGTSSIITTVNAPMSGQTDADEAVRLFESAADRMFRFIRMGREIEKITRLKQFVRNWEG